ncbi:unnamed protein product [Diamesa hyperborea]
MAASLARLNSGASTHYYAKENYYTKEEGIENSQWWGKGASYLDLSGKVDAEKFKNLMDGKDPEGKKYLGGVKPRERINKETGKPEQHRAGVDIAFAPPKSISIAALLDGRKDIEEAHKKAVDKTLKEIESKYSICRVGGRGQQTNKICGNLIVAKFEHDTSRSKDPQIHTHCVIISAVRKPDGEWRRIHNDGFWNNSKSINDKYLDNLKEELKKSKVPLVENTKNKTFEIKGYDNILIANFSKQTQKINKMKETEQFKKAVKTSIEHGRDENKAEKYVERILKIAERDKKGIDLSRDDLSKKWNEEKKEVLSIDKTQLKEDLGIEASGFLTKYIINKIEPMAAFPAASAVQILVGASIHDQSIQKESFQYIASTIGSYSLGSVGELIAGPIGGFTGGMIGSGLGYQLGDYIYTQMEKFTNENKAKSKEEKNINNKEEREVNNAKGNIDEIKHSIKEVMDMRRETKDKTLEKESGKSYDKDHDISKFFEKDKSKDKEIETKEKSNEYSKDDRKFDNKKDISLEQDKTKKREINFDEIDRGR